MRFTDAGRGFRHQGVTKTESPLAASRGGRGSRRITIMKRKPDELQEVEKHPEKHSPVKAMIEWLIEMDREYRAAQSMVNETHDKI
jgi:hypothetical protein